MTLGMSDDHKFCGACRYFDGDEDCKNIVGVCRRFPPVFAGRSDSGEPLFTGPEVTDSEWCGEFSRKSIANTQGIEEQS